MPSRVQREQLHGSCRADQCKYVSGVRVHRAIRLQILTHTIVITCKIQSVEMCDDFDLRLSIIKYKYTNWRTHSSSICRQF